MIKEFKSTQEYTDYMTSLAERTKGAYDPTMDVILYKLPNDILATAGTMNGGLGIDFTTEEGETVEDHCAESEALGDINDDVQFILEAIETASDVIV